MNKTETLIYDLSQKIAEENGVYIYSVEYVKEGPDMTLRICVDKDGGADIGDCENFSRALSSLLDEKDPIPGAYNLEVSTPGIERKLSLAWHFEKYIGSKVTVRFFKPENKAKQIVGILKEYQGGEIVLDVDGNDIRPDKSNISAVNLYYEW